MWLGFFMALPFVLSQTYSGGDGSATNPFKISTTADLKALSEAVNSGDRYGVGLYFEQTADLIFDFSDSGNFKPIGGYPDGEINPNKLKLFAGIYDGKNHTIENISIVEPTVLVALFSVIDEGACVKNVHIKHAYVSGNMAVAFICGINRGTIRHCSVDASSQLISAGSYLGGIAATSTATGKVEHCANGASIWLLASSQSIAGGIVGDNTGRISECYNYGRIQGAAYVGGITGFVRTGSEITYCYNRGEIEKNGQNETAKGHGGIAGCIAYDDRENPNIRIAHCYNAAPIRANEEGAAICGPILPADLSGIQEECYYDTALSLLGDRYAEGKSSQEMKSKEFVELMNQGASRPCFLQDEQNENGGYPLLAFQKGLVPETPETEEEGLVPFAPAIAVLPNQQFEYAIFIKSFPKEMKAFFAETGSKRFGMRLTSADQEIIKINENSFIPQKKGEAVVTIETSKPLKKGNEVFFDEKNIFAKTDVKVTVSEDAQLILPPIPQCNISKQETLAFFKGQGQTDITKDYLENNLTGQPDDNGAEAIIALTNMFYTPIVMYLLNEEGMLEQIDLLLSSYQMVTQEKSPARVQLEEKGFEYKGVSALTGGASYFNPATKTAAITSLIILQGNLYGVMSYVYDPDGEISGCVQAADTADRLPDFMVRDNGSHSLMLQTKGVVNKSCVVYNMKGEVLYKQLLSAEETLFQFDAPQLILIKVDGYKPFKAWVR